VARAYGHGPSVGGAAPSRTRVSIRVTCAPTAEEARAMSLDAAREMIASYREEGREPPIGGGHVEALTTNLAA